MHEPTRHEVMAMLREAVGGLPPYAREHAREILDGAARPRHDQATPRWEYADLAHRALQMALDGEPDKKPPAPNMDVIALALASIALELRALRQAVESAPLVMRARTRLESVERPEGS